ncbi:DNA-binding protein, partial [Acinetobacter ursingii]
SKDDADLRQLVDFKKKEIESYKDREKRYLDQIDRSQLLLGHKESEEKMSHDTPVTHSNDAPSDNNSGISETIDNNRDSEIKTSHETLVTRPNEKPKHVPITH